ncbi:hypothetical protein [Candidatus Palauibacter sp.]|uniref:hypothetical protein n=1 Tax=Candidatus Palauibacter sp. TaxID=3101350 RepID=UPI003CC5CFDD
MKDQAEEIRAKAIAALAAVTRQAREATDAERDEDIAERIWPDFKEAVLLAQDEADDEGRAGFRDWMEKNHAAKKAREREEAASTV